MLKIDAEMKAVIAHTPKAVPKTFEDLEAAARAMKDQDSRKESLFRQSVEAQKTLRAICWRRNFRKRSSAQRKRRIPASRYGISIWTERQQLATWQLALRI